MGHIFQSHRRNRKRASSIWQRALEKEVKEVDLSAPDFNGAEFKKDDLADCGCSPAFGVRRIPALDGGRERLKIAGKGAKLLLRLPLSWRKQGPRVEFWRELNDALEVSRAFISFRFCGCSREHSMVREVAEDVRDAKDCEELSGFGSYCRSQKAWRQKYKAPGGGTAHIRNLGKDACSTGKRRGCTVRDLVLTLSSGAISKKIHQVTDPEKCILCLRWHRCLSFRW